ncbi:hypothetical protein [Paraburkholderia haematera]|uniref:hypothetical protein n=1 Tax=Paraburkholderia haematera TaxID=2793077 RepID=UPI001B8BE39A|nr:hypothetical protein [Paraburkholderia haematera]
MHPGRDAFPAQGPAPQREQDVAIDIAYGGSCAAGKREDFDFYREVLRWGVEPARRV